MNITKLLGIRNKIMNECIENIKHIDRVILHDLQHFPLQTYQLSVKKQNKTVNMYFLTEKDAMTSLNTYFSNITQENFNITLSDDCDVYYKYRLLNIKDPKPFPQLRLRTFLSHKKY